MRTLLSLLLTVLILTELKSQTIDKNYIVNWLKAIDSNSQIDSVVVYKIDGKSYYTYDSAKLNRRLKQIMVSKLKSIFYSKYKIDNYVPGKGTIYILTFKEQHIDDIKTRLIKANELFIDSYISFSQHIMIDSKDPVLLIDNKSIHHTEVKDFLKKLVPSEIYDMSVNTSPVPTVIYGQNAKNGLVQIWTKSFLKNK